VVQRGGVPIITAGVVRPDLEGATRGVAAAAVAWSRVADTGVVIVAASAVRIEDTGLHRTRWQRAKRTLAPSRFASGRDQVLPHLDAVSSYFSVGSATAGRNHAC
jgi:hypothetical protein